MGFQSRLHRIVTFREVWLCYGWGMNESVTSYEQRPSATSAFVRGSMSGLFSGALMMGIVTLLSPLFGATMMATLTSAPLMILATTLFGGVMASKNAIFHPSAASNRSPNDPALVAVPMVHAPSIAAMPNMPVADQAPAAENEPTWVARTGRDEAAQSRIQAILDNGALSDKERASAILAARESSAAAPAARGA